MEGYRQEAGQTKRETSREWWTCQSDGESSCHLSIFETSPSGDSSLVKSSQMLEDDVNNTVITNGIVKRDYNETTSNLNIKTNITLPSQEKLLDNLFQSIDSTELSLLSNDELFEDFSSFDQASQLVDPALNDSESTPISFNNNDLVQLLRFNITESSENRNCNELYSKRNITEKCENLCDKPKRNDQYNLLQMMELLDSNVNVNVNEEMKKNGVKHNEGKIRKKEKDKMRMSGPIKKGRRYLENFKEKVLEYAKNHTFKETAVHFKVNSNTITEWSRESKRLRTLNDEVPLSKHNHKTDKHGTPMKKTEIILINDDISFETDCNDSSLKTIKEEEIQSALPSTSDMKADEIFLKWIQQKRVEKKELFRHQVFHMAKYCCEKFRGNEQIPLWFSMWLKRYNKVLNSVSSNIEIEKYIKYPESFKLEVVLYAKLFTKNSAARVFNVPRRRMFDWFNHLNVQNSQFCSGSNEKKDKTKNKIYSELHHWYQNMIFNGVRPNSNDIKEKAREIFAVHGMKEIKFSDGWLQKFCQRMNIKLRNNEDDQLLLWILAQFDNNVSLSHQEITEKSSSLIGRKKFKGSKGWTLRFLKRHKNLLQRCPTIADQLPKIAQEQLTVFWDNFRQSLSSLKLEPSNIGCMDEIPISFSYPADDSLKNPPLLRKTGFENCQGIVILSTLASGRVLPPTVIFKGTGPKQVLSGRNLDILVLYQEEGLITVEILETWLNDIWLSCAPSPNVLVVDSFEPHRAKVLNQLLTRENCLLHVIPDGCSSKFQPLDVEVTPSFKESIRSQWKEFPGGSTLYPPKLGRKYQCPDRDTILAWIQNAYEKVNRNPVSIINGFKTTGLIQ